MAELVCTDKGLAIVGADKPNCKDVLACLKDNLGCGLHLDEQGKVAVQLDPEDPGPPPPTPEHKTVALRGSSTAQLPVPAGSKEIQVPAPGNTYQSGGWAPAGGGWVVPEDGAYEVHAYTKWKEDANHTMNVRLDNVLCLNANEVDDALQDTILFDARKGQKFSLFVQSTAAATLILGILKLIRIGPLSDASAPKATMTVALPADTTGGTA